MIRHFMAALALTCLAGAARAEFAVDQLMGLLAQHPAGGRVSFVEKRYVAMLDRPVVATGEMFYRPPDRLEKRTRTPRPETLILDGTKLRIERDKRSFAISLANRPEALAFVDSIRGMLAGDRAALEKDYTLGVSGGPERWELTLVPSNQRIAEVLQRITVRGGGDRIRTIDYLLADGDRTELAIEALQP